MNIDILTQILRRFTIYLQDLPSNLRLMCHSLLFFLIAIEIALTIFNHIDDENFNYIKWGKMKILKVGFIIFAINKYEWILEGVKSFFFYAAEKAIRVSFFSNEYFEQPSLLYEQGIDLAQKIYYEGASFWHVSSWPMALLAFLILVGFLMITIQVIICWIEYYFLTGFSIIFLPFGALDMTGEFYRNVFKTIMGCSIKLAVMNFWLMLSTAIIKDIVKFSNAGANLNTALLVFGTLYVIVAIMQFLPSLTSGLLTASPTLNAGAAMTSAKGAAVGLFAGATGALKMAAHTYRGVKETAIGTYKGAQTGAKIGEGIGSVGGGAGMAVGKVLGGAIGGAVGGSYAGTKYAAFHEQHSKQKKEGDSKASKKSSNSKKNNSNTDNSSAADSTGHGNSPTSNNTATSVNGNVTAPGASNGPSNSQQEKKDNSSGGSNVNAATTTAMSSSGSTAETGVAQNNHSNAEKSSNHTTNNNGSTATESSGKEPHAPSSTGNEGNDIRQNDSGSVKSMNNEDSGKSTEREEFKNQLPDWLKNDY